MCVAAEADMRVLRNVVVMPGSADEGLRAGGYYHYEPCHVKTGLKPASLGPLEHYPIIPCLLSVCFDDAMHGRYASFYVNKWITFDENIHHLEKSVPNMGGRETMFPNIGGAAPTLDSPPPVPPPLQNLFLHNVAHYAYTNSVLISLLHF